MGAKTRIFFIVLSFLFQLSFYTYALAEPARISANASAREVSPSIPVPSKDRLTLVALFPIVAEGKMLGGLAVYDDARTKRPADYLELFDNVGTVVPVGWFDRFGIERLAVDRALLEDADQLEGVFVLVIEGDSV